MKIRPLEESIDQLKEYLRNFDLFEVMCVAGRDLQFTEKSLTETTGLSSPYRQYLYMASLAASTDQTNREHITPRKKRKIVRLLQRIALSYFEFFEPEDGPHLRPKSLSTAMYAFMHYFNVVTLAYDEQMIKRLRDWFLPFDATIRAELGFGVEDVVDAHTAYRENLLDKRQVLENAQDQGDPALRRALLNDHFRIPVRKFIERMGESTASTFLQRLSSRRQESSYRYYSDKGPIEKAPFFWLSDTEVACVFQKQILNACYELFYDHLLAAKEHDAFVRHRGRSCESQTASIFRRIVDRHGQCYESLYERPDSHGEHDIVLLVHRTIVICEVKSARIREPLREPSKAFPRIKDDFYGEQGIQNGYDQAARLKNLLLEQDQTILYNSRGNVKLTLNRSSYDEVLIAVVTAEDHGVLSVNLSHLLEKDPSEPYPWCCNLYALDMIADGIGHKTAPHEAFLQYIRERSEVHHRLVSDDELEVAGIFLCFGSLDSIRNADFEQVYLAPDNQEIFDHLYYTKHGVPSTFECPDAPLVVDFEDIRDRVVRNPADT